MTTVSSKRKSTSAGIWGFYPNVIAEFIKIPGYPEPHTPEIFNNAYFMRYRYRIESKELPQAKAIIISDNGLHSNLGHMEIAAQIVTEGKGDFEFWALGRRELGLQDSTGFKLAQEAKDPQKALDYYNGPKAKFIELSQEDIPFLAHWGLEVHIKDFECILNLIPKQCQATNVFLMGHSQGCRRIFNIAGYQFPDGKAGFEKIAGHIYLDAGPKIDNNDAGTKATLADYQKLVQSLIEGKAPLFGGQLIEKSFSPVLSRKSAITALLGFLEPEGQSPYKITDPPIGGKEAAEFLIQLKLTNEAYYCWQFDDDPIPGSLTQMKMLLYGYSVSRCGKLDFPSLKNPHVPIELLDKNKVYGWISGGAGEEAGQTDDGPYNCYPSNQEPNFQHYPPNPNPTRSDRVCLSGFFSGERTNINGPTQFKFQVSGQLEIYEGNPAGNRIWYSSQRFYHDVHRAMGLSTPELNITRKADINSPILVYQKMIKEIDPLTPEQLESMTKITDWTYIGKDGVHYSSDARKLTTFPSGTNARLYTHSDFLNADNSLGGKVTPGEIGANVTTNTAIPWMLSRVNGTTPVPDPVALGIK